MVGVLGVLAAAVIAVGMLASVAPFAPAGVIALGGVYGYWLLTGFAKPGALTLVVLTALGVTAVLAENVLAGAAARRAGASKETVAAAGVAGLVLYLFAGPVGGVLGIALTVFAVEFHETREAEGSVRAAFHAGVGVVAAAAVELALTASMLVVFLVFGAG